MKSKAFNNSVVGGVSKNTRTTNTSYGTSSKNNSNYNNYDRSGDSNNSSSSNNNNKNDKNNTLLRRWLFALSETSSSIFPKTHRTFTAGYLCIVIKYYYLLQANFQDYASSNTSDQRSGNVKTSILSYAFLFARINRNQSNLSSLLYLIIIINFILLTYFIVRVIMQLQRNSLASANGSSSSGSTSGNSIGIGRSSFERSSTSSILNKQNTGIKALDLIFSMYNYVLFIPQFYLALVFHNSDMLPSVVALIFISINSLFTKIGDYSYDYLRVDSLSKRNSNGFVFELIFDIIGMLLNYWSEKTIIVYTYYLCFSLCKLAFIIFAYPYHNEAILKLNVQMASICAYTSMVLLIDDTYATMAVLTSIPCASTFGSHFFNRRLDKVIVRCMDHFKLAMATSAASRGYLVHHLQCYFTEYSQSKLSPFLEQIISDHVSTCQLDANSCFCHAIPENNRRLNGNDSVERERFLDQTDKKKYLHNYLKHIYISAITRVLSKRERNDAYFSYFSFLGQIMQNYSTVFLEMQAYRATELASNIGAIDQSRLQREIFRLNESFFRSQNNAQISNNMTNSNHSNSSSISTTTAQQSQKDRNSLFTIITFDEKLNSLENMFRECLSKKQQLLILISQSDIALTQLQVTLQSLFDSREILNQHFKDIIGFACYSSYLRVLCEGYELSLKPSSNVLQQIKYIKKMQPHISKIPHYDEESCVAFVSLQPSTLGRIARVSKNFYDVTKTFTNKEAIGKSIDFLIPKNLVQQHGSMLRSYFKSEAIDLGISEKPKLIGQNAEGWAVQYSMKFQVSYTDTMTDLGLAVWVRCVEDERLHIVTDLSSQLRVHTLSQEIYENIFADIVSPSQIHQIQIAKWIPLLMAHRRIYEMNFSSDLLHSQRHSQKEQGENQQNNNPNAAKVHTQNEKSELSFESILIKPNADNLDYKINEETFFEDLMGLELYGVTFTVLFVRNPFLSYMNITISSIEQLSNFEDQQDYILRFKQQAIDFDIRFDQAPLPHMQHGLLTSLHSTKYLQSNMKFSPNHQHKNKKPKESLFVQTLPKTTMMFATLEENQEEHQLVEEELVEDGTPGGNDKNNNLLQDQSLQLSIRGQVSSRQIAGSFHALPIIQQQPTTGGGGATAVNNSSKLTPSQLDAKGSNSMRYNQESTQDYLIEVNSQQNLTQNLPQITQRGDEQHTLIEDMSLLQQQKSGYMELQKVYTKQPPDVVLTYGETKQGGNNGNANTANESALLALNNSVNNSSIVNFATAGAPGELSFSQTNHRKEVVQQQHTKLTTLGNSSRMKKLSIFQKQPVDGKISISNSMLEKKEGETKGRRTASLSHYRMKQNNNKQSLNSSGYSSEKSQRYILERFISKSNGLTGIQIINIMGGVSVLAIAIISLISFIDNYQQLTNDQENFQYVDWLSSINAAVSIVNTDLAIKQNTEVGFFVLTDEAKIDLMSAILVDMTDYDKILRNLLLKISMGNSQDLIMFNQLIGIDADEYLYSGTSTKVITTRTTFINKIIAQAGYLTMQAHLLDSKQIFQHFSELNFPEFNDLILSVTESINTRFQTQSDSQQANIVFWLFVFGSISLLFILSVIPTYAFIINKQQQILYLFATIEPERIVQMEENIMNCRIMLMGNAVETKSSRKLLENTKIIQRKKKNISNTIPLSPSYAKLITAILCVFIFIQLQPATDYFLSTAFLKACSNRYTLIVKVMNMQQMINEIIQARQNYMTARFYSTYATMPLSYYQEFVGSRSTRSQQVYREFFEILENKSLYNTYETELVDNFFYASIEKNACSTIEAYPEYQNNIEFNRTTCETSNKGVLKSGISVAMNDFVSGFVDFNQQSLGSDDALFLSQVNMFFTNMRDRFYAKKYLTNSLEFLIYFLKTINHAQYANQLNVLKVLIVWQLLTIFFSFIFGFTRYSQYIQAQVQQTKEYIGLIEIPVLIFNPYILSYLRKFQ